MLHITATVLVLILLFIFLLNKDLYSTCLNQLVCFIDRLSALTLPHCRAVRVANLKSQSRTCAGLFVSTGEAKEQRLTSSDPLTSISTPSHRSPPDLILLLSKLSRNCPRFSATASSICLSPLPLHPLSSFVPLPPSPKVDYTSVRASQEAFFIYVKMHQPRSLNVELGCDRNELNDNFRFLAPSHIVL